MMAKTVYISKTLHTVITQRKFEDLVTAAKVQFSTVAKLTPPSKSQRFCTMDKKRFSEASFDSTSHGA